MKGGERVPSNPIGEAVSQMDPPRYLVGDAAALIRRSVDTLERWRDEGILIPSDARQFGSLVVFLYTPDDIRKGKEIARNRKRGRQTHEQLELKLSWASDTQQVPTQGDNRKEQRSG